MRVCFSSHRDIAVHLAIEDELLDQAGADDEPLLLFYVNDPAVVLGRNQNPWLETRPAFLRQQATALARRVTGGGTVYHDVGNLNYAMILPRTAYHRDRVFAGVLAGLRRCGVDAVRSGSHSLMADGRKFSGSAFCFRRSHALHHGTMLLNSDLARLEHAIQPSAARLTTKAVASIRSQVLNLAELRPRLSVEELQAALAEGLAAEFGWARPRGAPEEVQWLPDERRLAQHRSMAWIYNDCPAFTLEIAGRGAGIRIERGRVSVVNEALPGHQLLDGVMWEPGPILSALAEGGDEVQTFWGRVLADLF